jgi:LuxR family maltose regulon positive regulatory protein
VIEILQTKFYIPSVRSDLVPRLQLIDRLSQGLKLGHKLTLVSAPAGFGKTTLLSEWLAGLRAVTANKHHIENLQLIMSSVAASEIPHRLAWLSLDEGDNDPVRFLTYLVTALNQAEGIESDIGKGALGMLQSPQPPPVESILTSLINDIAASPDSIILVLDDYHLIDSLPVDNVLTFILEHLPAQMQLVIATRIDPNLPLSRLRARGQLTELRASELRFSSSEAAEFLNRAMNLDLSAEDIITLESRTEGWIAGLQLAAISLQGRQDSASLIESFSGSHRFVLDYLIEEVLEQQSESVQTFLLQTTILDQLTGSLCDALTDNSNGQATLGMLERANLFIVPLDNDRCWYRYHHLFADLLRQRLLQTQPERLPALHRRASEWYEENGFVDEAIEHALHGEYFERAAYLIEDQYCVNYERNDQSLLQGWLAELPEELVISRPQLIVLRVWILFNRGQLDAAVQNLQVADKLLDPDRDRDPISPSDRGQLSKMDRKILAGRVAIIRSFLASYSGDTPGIISYARQALEILPHQELEWRSAAYLALGGAYASMGQMESAREARSNALAIGRASGDTYYLTIVYLDLAETLRQQGRLREVIDICERRLKIAEENGFSESELVGWLLGIWGEVLVELNDLDGAINRAEDGVKLATRGLDVLYEVMSKLYLVRVLFSSGKLSDAEEVIQSMENPARHYEIPQWALSPLSAWQARIWLEQGELKLASQWVEDHQLDAYVEPVFQDEITHAMFARILIAQGRLDEADNLLQRLLEAARSGGRTSRVIELLILQSLATQTAGDTPGALSTLEQALLLGQTEGFIRTFVNEGPPMARLLYEALSSEISSKYVRQLLAAFPTPEPQQAEASQTLDPDAEWVEPLSERELEVIQLIAEGLKNQEISERLFLSLNTVKAHNRNIFSKLGVNSRTQAVARARALGILKST